MRNAVLFIQGGGEGGYAADSELAVSLQRALGADYDVRYPHMPSEGAPDYATWKRRIERELSGMAGEVILVGHSAGGYMLLKYLGEESVPKALTSSVSIAGICLIATPFPGGDNDWQFEGFSLPENLAAKLPDTAKVFLYHSRDDQTAPFAHVALYARELPNASVRETSGGHQLNNDLSLVAQDIGHVHPC
jgi:serine hydrolase